MKIERIERFITKMIYNTLGNHKSEYRNFVPILAYHEICELPKEINNLHSYNVTPSAFEEQMEFLHKNDYSVISLEELISHLNKEGDIPQKAVVITFDDGYKNNYTNAFPVLKKFDFSATIFLATDYIGSNKIFPWVTDICGDHRIATQYWLPLTWEEIEEMGKDNVTFGSHTCLHSNIRRMTVTAFESEVGRSRDEIERKIHKKVELFSYPFSFPKYRARYRQLINETRAILVRNGFLGACTTIIGNNSLYSDPLCLKRIQIRSTDDLFQFRAKIEGAYNWMGLAQEIYQKLFEPLIEITHGNSIFQSSNNF